jgi:hypothetical protein
MFGADNKIKNKLVQLKAKNGAPIWRQAGV